MNCKLEIKKIRKFLKDYAETNKLQSFVVGVSGGIDSTLVCALAYPVCRELGIPLVAWSLPSNSNKRDELSRALMVCKAFAPRTFTNMNIDEEVDNLNLMVEVCEETKRDKIRIGNIKARVRMVILYNSAFVNKGVVLSTDNYTEYLLGFWTLHGDVGDLAPIQYYWKTEVYKLAEWLEKNELHSLQKDAMYRCINAVPTDGLGITNSDLDQLCAPTYKEVDKILKAYMKNGAYKNHPVVSRHKISWFKRNNPFFYHRSPY